MVMRQVTFRLDGALRGKFEAFWKEEYLPAMSRQQGFLEARLMQDAVDQGEYQMLIEFASEESSAAWRASIDHNRLKPLFKGFIPVSSLRVLKPLD
jgi:heme-degrading monooxygenase HmoA